MAQDPEPLPALTDEPTPPAGPAQEPTGPTPATEEVIDAGLPKRSALRLNLYQRVELHDYIVRRLQDLKEEMGRGPNGTNGGWMLKRQRAMEAWRDNREARKMELQGVFKFSNYSLNILKRAAKMLASRANRDMFGTDPIFSAIPEGVNDAAQAAKVDQLAQFKLRSSGLKTVGKEANRLAFILGERVVKVTHRVEREKFKTRKEVLMTRFGGIWLTRKGRPITRDDWMQDPISGQMVCRHDPMIVMPERPIYAEKIVDEELIRHKGPVYQGIDYRDFLCPLKAPSIQKADFCAHLYAMEASEALLVFNRPDLLRGKEGVFWKILHRMREVLTRSFGPNITDLSGATEDKAERGENSGITQRNAGPAYLQIAECYFRYDIDKDGSMPDIVAIVAFEKEGDGQGTLLYWNYVAECFPQGRRPFEVMARYPETDRWYGVGLYEEFEEKDLFIDLCFNRENFANMREGNLMVFNYNAVEDQNRQFELGDGRPWKAKEGKSIEDILQVKRVIEPTEGIRSVRDAMLQMLQLEIGVMNEAEGQVAGTPSSDTATGINANAETADNLLWEQMGHLEGEEGCGGLTGLIQQGVNLTLWHLDPIETFTYMEGDTQKIETLRREEVQNLRMNVRLLLTRRKVRQQMEQDDKAVQLMMNYTQTILSGMQQGLPLETLQAIRQLFIQRAKGLEVQQADRVFFDPATLQMQAPPPGLPPGEGAAPPMQGVA
jgi:hypothetical protein